MLKVAIIIGSTRPNRVGDAVGNWVYDLARQRGDAEYELIDLKSINLPLLDEPTPAASNNYQNEHTKSWSQKIETFDAFIFVSAEYNHGIPAALKNSMDYLYKEWNNKVCGFVAYGSAGGVRSVEALRLVCAELQMASVRSQVALNLMTDFENYKKFKPASFHETKLSEVIDQVLMWGTSFKEMRQPKELLNTAQDDSTDQVSLQ